MCRQIYWRCAPGLQSFKRCSPEEEPACRSPVKCRHLLVIGHGSQPRCKTCRFLLRLSFRSVPLPTCSKHSSTIILLHAEGGLGPALPQRAPVLDCKTLCALARYPQNEACALPLTPLPHLGRRLTPSRPPRSVLREVQAEGKACAASAESAKTHVPHVPDREAGVKPIALKKHLQEYSRHARTFTTDRGPDTPNIAIEHGCMPLQEWCSAHACTRLKHAPGGLQRMPARSRCAGGCRGAGARAAAAAAARRA